MLLFVGPENGSVITRSIVPLNWHTGDVSRVKCPIGRVPQNTQLTRINCVHRRFVAVYYLKPEPMVLLRMSGDRDCDTGALPLKGQHIVQ